jgi:hypothetical protein
VTVKQLNNTVCTSSTAGVVVVGRGVVFGVVSVNRNIICQFVTPNMTILRLSKSGHNVDGYRKLQKSFFSWLFCDYLWPCLFLYFTIVLNRLTYCSYCRTNKKKPSYWFCQIFWIFTTGNKFRYQKIMNFGVTKTAILNFSAILNFYEKKKFLEDEQLAKFKPSWAPFWNFILGKMGFIVLLGRKYKPKKNRASQKICKKIRHYYLTAILNF